MRVVLSIALTSALACGRHATTPLRWEPRSEGTAAVVEAWVTTGDRKKLLFRDSDIPLDRGEAPPLPTIAVDETAAYQTMVGFGAAITDASAWLIETRLGPLERDAL